MSDVIVMTVLDSFDDLTIELTSCAFVDTAIATSFDIVVQA
jgi:hypothetical protein